MPTLFSISQFTPPELVVAAAIISLAWLVIAVLIAVALPKLYREARTWFPKREVIDFDARRRELALRALAGETPCRPVGKIGAAGYPHRRVH